MIDNQYPKSITCCDLVAGSPPSLNVLAKSGDSRQFGSDGFFDSDESVRRNARDDSPAFFTGDFRSPSLIPNLSKYSAKFWNEHEHAEV